MVTTVTLTVREEEVVHLIIEGLTDKEIASQLGIQMSTAKTHTSHVLEKLGASSRTKAAVVYLKLEAHATEDEEQTG